jgi:hypothetical protein
MNESNTDPVTLVFSWKVKRGKEKEFEKWAHETTTAASHFEGHLGANWIKPPANSRNFTVIYKFDTTDNFMRWEKSSIRHNLLNKAKKLTDNQTPKKIEQITGLETWFTLPGSLTIKPPPKWKMVIATAIGIYPIGLIFQAFVAPHMNDIPLLLRPVVLSLILTPLMTYAIMPNITKLFQSWLYPNK